MRVDDDIGMVVEGITGEEREGALWAFLG